VADEMITHDRGAEERAATLAGAARDEARGVVDDAREEGSGVVSEASAQAHNLVDEARSAVRRQASDGTGRAAGALNELGTRLRALGDGDVERAGDLSRYADDLSQRVRGVADRLSNRGLDGIVDDLQAFARRRPRLFLAAAATSGFAAGRLFRGAQSQAGRSTPGPRSEQAGSDPPGSRLTGESDAERTGPAAGSTPAPTPHRGVTSTTALPEHGSAVRDTGGPR
jgi:uncharacterized protein YjbJ (UPF0337 family)